MSIRDVALTLKNWAKKNHMISGFQEAPAVNQSIINSLFRSAGLTEATRILQNRQISYIGIDELKDKIIIFTPKKLTITEQRMLASAQIVDDGRPIALSFQHSDVLKTGGEPVPPIGVPPFAKHNNRYTCGSSVYLGSEKGAGTLGCLVRDREGHIYGLSNNHVTGGSNYAVPGLPIVAPGMLDVTAGGQDPVTIGHHSRAHPFIDGLPDIVSADDNLDAAIFKLSNPDLVSSFQRDLYDTPAQVENLEIGMEVQKVGRTTGKTQGQVIAELFDCEPVNYHVDIIGGRKIVFFRSLFMIKGNFENFSSPGDSGSLITVLRNGHPSAAVGIVVAGNQEGNTLALSINRILEHFDVELVSNHNV